MLILQFWARFCLFQFFPLLIFSSVLANLTYIISYFSSPVKFWYYCYKSYQIDQIRRLSYWVNTIVSVKIALTSNYAHKSVYLLIMNTLLSFPHSLVLCNSSGKLFQRKSAYLAILSTFLFIPIFPIANLQLGFR